MKIAIEKTFEFFQSYQVDESHGFAHALEVLTHAEKMLACETAPIDSADILAVKLAALLHDVDDRKLFPQNKNYENARLLLEQIVPANKAVHNKAIEMIKCVSTSANGNTIDQTLACWMLFPRFADRLEAIGPVGVTRCLAYTKHQGRPLFVTSTLTAMTEEELWKIATQERFQQYLTVKNSLSFIDHFYDKLLHIGTVEALGYPKNSYLAHEAINRHHYMVRYVLDFWHKNAHI